MWRVIRAAVVAVLGGIGTVNAQDLPGQEPQLVIEPGMHISRINAIAVDGACTLLATASGDKTVRLWRLPEGDLLKTLRGPIGPGEEGKFNAVAMDAGGSWIAAGGWTRSRQHWIYIFETATRAVATRLGPLPDVIQNLAVSRDGQYLAATLGGKLGLRVWQRTGKDLAAWSLVAEDKNYADQAHGVTFDATGTLYTVAYDGKIRRYASGYTAKPVSVATQGGKRPFTIAVHPSSDRVAVGFVDTVAVEVYDAQSLARRLAADTSSVRNGNLAVVGWSADGARLYGGGRYDKGAAMGILVWERGGEGSARDLDGPLNTISQFLPCGDALAVGATDPLFGLLAADDSHKLWRGNVQADMRRKLGDRFLLSDDGMRVRFGLKEGDPNAKEGDSSSAPAAIPATYPPLEPVLFDLRNERLTDSLKAPGDLFAADVQSLPVTDWINNFNPKFQGKAIGLLRDERARSLAIAPNKQQFILGADWSLRAFDSSGKPQWKREVPGVVWGVNISRDGNVLVAAYGDGTVRWHRLKDGAELLSLFVFGKDRRWVAWTPKGYYTASAGGEGLIGWHVNRGWNESADFFPAHRFRNRFYRPDVVQQVLNTLDEDKAIAEADRLAGTGGQERDIRKLRPPVVEIVSHKDGDKFSDPRVTIQYSARSPTGETITEVDIYVDGAKQTLTASTPTAVNDVASVPLELPRNDVTIKIVAKAGDKESVARAIKLIWDGAKPAARLAVSQPKPQPRLLALLVGVSTYANQEKLTANGLEKLNFAHLDAQNLSDALKNQEGKAFLEVVPKVLIDADAKTIRQGITWLKKTATKDDLTLIFLSGHGKTELNTFYFLSSEADLDDLTSTAINGAEIVTTIKGLPGRKLVVVDACRAGGGITPNRSPAVRMNDLVNDMTTGNIGVVFFGSSGVGQLSYENSNVKAGAFTHALIAGLSDKADLNKDGKVETWELESWLKTEVPKLTGGQPQDPLLYPSEPGLEYTIAHN